MGSQEVANPLKSSFGFLVRWLRFVDAGREQLSLASCNPESKNICLSLFALILFGCLLICEILRPGITKERVLPKSGGNSLLTDLTM